MLKKFSVIQSHYHGLYHINSMITAELKNFFTPGATRPFLRINRGVQILPISAHEMMPMYVFGFYKDGQKWLSLPQMTF